MWKQQQHSQGSHDPCSPSQFQVSRKRATSYILCACVLTTYPHIETYITHQCKKYGCTLKEGHNLPNQRVKVHMNMQVLVSLSFDRAINCQNHRIPALSGMTWSVFSLCSRTHAREPPAIHYVHVCWPSLIPSPWGLAIVLRFSISPPSILLHLPLQTELRLRFM